MGRGYPRGALRRHARLEPCRDRRTSTAAGKGCGSRITAHERSPQRAQRSRSTASALRTKGVCYVSVRIGPKRNAPPSPYRRKRSFAGSEPDPRPLTASRSKPAVPIAGKYRLVDIPISNCINSNINRIFVLTQYNSASLNKHIKNTYQFSAFSRKKNWGDIWL